MRAMRPRLLLAAVLLAAALAPGGLGCDRAIEPYSDDPVEAPDLSKIFPPGAERAPQDGPMGGAAPDRGAPPPPPPSPAGETAAAPVSGTVSVDPALEGRISRRAVVFVMLRMGEAGPPVAVKKIESPQFPLAFEIGPDDRMMQGMPFTGPFQLSARIDSDGNATTRLPGDLQGTYPTPVTPGQTSLHLHIDHPL